MKKFIFLLVIICGYLVIGCKKDKDSSSKINEIAGYWDRRTLNTTTQNYFVEQFQFNTNGSYSHIYSIHDKATFLLLGYSGISSGRFKIENQTILLYDGESYNKNSTDEYVPQSSLTKVQSVDVTAQYSVDNKKGTLSLTYNCPPNADCVGTTNFNRSMAVDKYK
ncbi:hypothetical protein MUGA111182_19150 [Mucilaginibacter galii]|uniref:hypothetical protein n=1 Tax=Mucilaginibacter galii TaxID=2005073 RepID=UPI00166F35D2|nr:hypothetical protein [Mucilaginibacter galii]